MKENHSPLCIAVTVFLPSMNFMSLYMLWGKKKDGAFSYSYRGKEKKALQSYVTWSCSQISNIISLFSCLISQSKQTKEQKNHHICETALASGNMMIENVTIKSGSVEDWELLLLITQGLEATDLKWEPAHLNQQKYVLCLLFWHLLCYTHYRSWAENH